MPNYRVVVSRGVHRVENTNVHIEATNESEANEKAVIYAEANADSLDWSDVTWDDGDEWYYQAEEAEQL